MRAQLAVLTLIAIAVASPFTITVNYYNPFAVKRLGVPLLNVKISGDVNPSSGQITNLQVAVNTTTPLVIENYTQIINNALSTCQLNGTPLLSVVNCAMNAIGKIIGVQTVTTFKSMVSGGVGVNGYLNLAIQYSVSVNVYGEKLSGQALYSLIGGDAGIKEQLDAKLTNGKGAYLQISANVNGEVGTVAEYYKFGCNGKLGVVTASAPSPAPPTVLQGLGYVKLVFPVAVVKYAIAYLGPGTWVPRTFWIYYEVPQKTVTLPLSCPNVQTISAFPQISTNLNCQTTINVAMKGEHDVSMVSPNGFRIKIHVQPFKDVVVPIPCKGDVLVRVDNSTFLTTFNAISNKKIVVVPKSPVLRLVNVTADKPFELDFNGYKVSCGTTCTLAIPPSTFKLVVVDPVTKASKLVYLGPTASSIKITVPTKQEFKSCGSFLVAPKPTSVVLYFPNTTSIIDVTNEPKYVVLPCDTPIQAKVGGTYMVTFTVKDGSWVVFCPGSGVSTGSALKVTAEMKTPISFSCDNGVSWVIVNSNKFTVIKPDYPLMILKLVGADGKMSQIYVPLGIKEVVAFPNVKTREQTQLPPSMPLTQIVEVNLHNISGPDYGVLRLSDGKYVLTYPISGKTKIAIPPQWTQIKLQGLLLVNGTFGLKMFNFTLPELQSGKWPNGKPVIANINIFSDAKAKGYYYYTLKLIISDQNGNPKVGKVTIDGKYSIEVKGATIIVYPKRMMTITFAGKSFHVALNGQTVYLNVTTPTTKNLLTLNSYIPFVVMRNGKPINVTVTLEANGVSLTYNVNGTGRVAVPSSWLNQTLMMTIVYNGTTHQTVIPPIYGNNTSVKVIAPIYVFLDDLNKYSYYSGKIVLVTKSGLLVKPSKGYVIIDNKYKVLVNGAAIIVYPKRVVELKYPGGQATVSLQGTEIYLTVPPPKKQKVQQQTNVTGLPGISLPQLMKKGVIKPWNPWDELPAFLMLASSLWISLGIVYTAPNLNTLGGAIAYTLASITVVVVFIALAVWFANTIGAPP